MRIISAALVILSFPAAAIIEITDNIALGGFGSSSWAKSDNATSLMIHRGFVDDNCYDCDTTFGVQLDYYYDALKASIQVVKRPQDSWDAPQIEWAYIGYGIDDFDIHVGTLRLPLFLTSEYYYVGHAYKMARPPTEVYNSILGITAFNGVDVSWNIDINDTQSLVVTPFYGFEDENEVNYSSSTTLNFSINSMLGFNARLSSDNYRWNFALLNAQYDQTNNVRFGEQVIVVQSDNQSLLLWSLGAEYEIGSTLLTIEAQINDYSSSWYSSIAYQHQSVTPYISYGTQYDAHEKIVSNSYLVGLRYDLYFNLSINGELQYFDLTKDRGTFLSSPTENDALLYTVMFNFVF